MSQYAKVNALVEKKCREVGRAPDSVTVIAVSKGRALEDIADAYAQGCRHFGENRVEEFFDKSGQLPSNIFWHMIGHIQKKKVNKVVNAFSLLHSIDTLELAEKVNDRSQSLGLITPILLECNTSGEESKLGLDPDTWNNHWPKLIELKGISIMGLMTMAPLTENEKIIRQTFRTLRQFQLHLRELRTPNAPLKQLSMGMSNDWEIAIEEGSTLLRIGKAIFD